MAAIDFQEESTSAVDFKPIDFQEESAPEPSPAEVASRLGIPGAERLRGDLITGPTAAELQQLEQPLVTIPEQARTTIGRTALQAVLGPAAYAVPERVPREIGESVGGMIEGLTSPIGIATIPATIAAPSVMLPELVKGGLEAGVQQAAEGKPIAGATTIGIAASPALAPAIRAGLRPAVAEPVPISPRALPAPGESAATFALLPESPIGPRTAGYRVQLPPEQLGERPPPLPVQRITPEDALALRDAIEIGKAAEPTKAKPYQPPTVKTDLRQLEKIMQRNTVSSLESWANETVRAKLTEAGANPFLDPEFMAAAVVKGTVLVKRGVVNFADWSEPMIKQFGKDAEPYLRGVYDEAVAAAGVKITSNPAEAGQPAVTPAAQPPPRSGEPSPRPATEQSIWQRFLDKHFERATPPEVFKSATPVEPPTVDALATAIRDSKPARRETEALRRVERAQRAAVQARIQAGEPGRAGVGQLKGALKGELPRVDLEPFADKLTSVQQDSLYNHIYGHELLADDVYRRSNLAIALQNLIEYGHLPQPNQVAWFERIFGPQVAQAMLGKQRVASRTLRFLAEWANLPRTAITGYDLSAIGRQGFSLGVAHPEVAFEANKAQLNAFKDRAYALATDRSLRTGERARIRDDAGLELPSVEGLADTTREEVYTSRLVQNLQDIRPKSTLAKVLYNPIYYYAKGLAGSERAYVTYLNWLRANVFDSVDAIYQDAQLPEGLLSQKRHQLAMLLNSATGRGNVPSNALLNAVFFSTKFQASRFEYPFRLAKVSATEFKTQLGREARRQLVAHAAAWTSSFTLMHLASKAFGWNVDFGIDPRSGDFLKIRAGDNVLVDVGAGYGQTIRLMARFLTGETVNIKTDRVKDQPDFQEELGRFVKYKLAPVPGEIWKIRDYAVDKPNAEEVTPLSVARDLFVPIPGQNAHELWNEFGATGLSLMVPDLLGFGVTVLDQESPRAR